MGDAPVSSGADSTGRLILGWDLDSGRGGGRDPSIVGASRPGVAFEPTSRQQSAVTLELVGPEAVEGPLAHPAGSSPGGADDAPPTFPEPGERLADFRILGELGRGAFARVYLAEQEGLARRRVALKVSRSLGGEPQALARLQHAHIVPIYSVHDDPGSGLRLLCMPYFGGANLAQVLETAGGRAPTQATGQSLVEALDQVGGADPDEGSRPASAAARPWVSGAGASRPYGAAATRGVGSPSLARSLWARHWAHLPWWRRLERDAGPAADPERGRPARQYLRSHTYVQAAAWIAARLAEGLEHAHARGLLHRDLKPSNILIAADGTPMLLDFNLAVEAEPDDSAGGERAMLGGTLPYMAPEHLDAFNTRGQTPPDAVDHRADVYALGLILFEMLAGHHPFPDPPGGVRMAEVLRLMTAHRLAGASSARATNPLVPPSLDAIVRRCLEPDPARRYQTAGELAEDLRRFLDDRPLAFTPEPSYRERAAKWLRRHPGWRGAGPAAAVGLVVVLTIAAAAGGMLLRAERAQARVAREAFRSAFRRCQIELNTAGPASHLTDGLARADAALRPYRLDAPGDWAEGPLVRRLSPPERAELAEELAELILLRARGRVARAERRGDATRVGAERAEAVAWLDRAERIDPHPPAALFEERARLCAALGEAARAEADRRRAAATPPRTSRDFYLIGTALAARGEADRAEPPLARAVALDPARFWAWFALGLCHYDQARYGDAASDFAACTILAPSFAWPHVNRGLALAAAGRLVEARAAYDRAVAADPRSAEALVNRGVCALELGDAEAAESDLIRAGELGADGPEVRAALGEARARLGRRAEASRDFEAALAARPSDPRLWTARGFARRASDPLGAATDFERALALDPDHARARLGRALLRRGAAPRAALEDLDQALRVAPGLAEARQVRALVRGRLGDAGAVADAEQLAATPTPHNLYNAACALALRARAAGDARAADRAATLLGRALDAGFPAAEARSDPDLEAIRGRPEIRARLSTNRR